MKPICPVCSLPAHAAESDDLDTHAHCQITAERFAEIWDARGPFGALKPTESEHRIVTAYWKTLGDDTCWQDAFHAMWRAADSAGHAKKFAGTFYATAESMRADDEDLDETAHATHGGVTRREG